MRSFPGRLLVVGLIIVCSWLPITKASAEEATAHKWRWSITPYLFASDVDMSVLVSNEPVLGGSVDFKDLLDKVDVVFPVHFKGQKGRHGFLFDVFYMSLSNSKSIMGPLPIPLALDTDTALDMLLLEMAGIFRPGGGEYGLDLLYGVRLIEEDIDLLVTLPTPPGGTTGVNFSESYWDVFGGVKYSGQLGSKWGYNVRGDVATGGTELTWNIIGLIAYHLGQTGKYTLHFGYRHMDIEIEESAMGGDVTIEQTLSGPLIGFNIAF